MLPIFCFVSVMFAVVFKYVLTVNMKTITDHIYCHQQLCDVINSGKCSLSLHKLCNYLSTLDTAYAKKAKQDSVKGLRNDNLNIK